METDKLSVIIPVYNAEEYISTCLNSILLQSYSNFEAICVDDGSKDKSGEICEKYAKQDSRIMVFHIENRGVSNARNFGITKITGEWFSFIDADDWVEPCFLEILYHNAIRNNCDISACGFQRNAEYIINQSDRYSIRQARTVLLNSSSECIHNFICSKDSMQGMVWNKLYKTSVFKDIHFDISIKVNEDCIYIYNIMQKCRKACFSTLKLYHWLTRMDSACHTKNIPLDFTAANVFRTLYEDTLKYEDAEMSSKLQINYINSAVKVFLYASYKRNNSDVLSAKKLCTIWRKNIWNSFDMKHKVKYYIAFYTPWLMKLLNKA